MIFNLTSVHFSALALGAFLFAAPVTTVHGSPATSSLSSAQARGGQAPSQAAGGNTSYMAVVARNLAKPMADKLRQDLNADGFTTAQTRQDSDGKYRVVLGGLPSDAQAKALIKDLKDAGYTPSGVEADTGNSAVEESSVFRVQVAEFSSENEAQQASKSLADEGFVNVDVVEDDGKYLVMLGTFNDQNQAKALLGDVNNAGFALAQVVERQRARATASTGAAASTGANVSQATKDVLSLAEKVESGDASAQEFRELRQKKQQLPESEKQIVEQQEQNRAANQQNQQQVFDNFRKFDRAMAARNYPQAQQALEAVRQIDPSNVNLASRENALAEATGQKTPAPRTASGIVDPAVVQQMVNDARKLESEGKKTEALSKYREALDADPGNIDAKSRIAELAVTTADENSGSTANAATGESTMAHLMENKPLVYGGGAVLALIILVLIFKRKKTAEPTPARGSSFGTTSGADFIDPLNSGDTFATSTGSTEFSALGTGGNDISAVEAGAVGAGMAPPAFSTFGSDDDEEEKPVKRPAPKPRPEPAVEESDTVSLDGFGTSEPAITPEPAAALPAAEETINIDMVEDNPVAAAVNQEQPGGNAADEDLESLLKGTFPGAPAGAAAESPLESATPGRGVEDLQPAGVTGPGEPRLVYEESFEQQPDGAAPAGWSGEYDYASITVEYLNEPGHTQCLCFHKSEGTGSATYHLQFPKAQGLVTAEFDIRCDQKNKFLLGVYLEKDEDFKQSVHTIVHQLDANSPAALRMQGVATPYDMMTWRHVRYEIDLPGGVVNGWLDNEQVVTNVALANAPEYINTLSIRDNLATTGTLLLDNIRISEG